jgi:hypothetical protein
MATYVATKANEQAVLQPPAIRNEQADTHNDRALADKRASNKVVKS